MAWEIESRFEYDGRLYALWRCKDCEGRPTWAVEAFDESSCCWREPPPGAGYYDRETAMEAAGVFARP